MLEAAAGLLSPPPFIGEIRAHTPVAIHTPLRELRTKKEIGLVIVDHLQLMKVTGRAESRHQELSEICHGSSGSCGQMGCVVLLLSQLNRACEQGRRRPNQSDLKEPDRSRRTPIPWCSSIERSSASATIQASGGKAEFIAAKQRNGPTSKPAMPSCTPISSLRKQLTKSRTTPNEHSDFN
jgi:replicative DNA helicase